MQEPKAVEKKRFRWGILLLAVVLVVILSAGGVALWARSNVKASLAQLDGEQVLPGLGGPVFVERDRLGTPSIRAESRIDAMRTLGFVHAQERFFQMDLLRRNASGRLAELAPAALEMDKQARIHDFQRRAREGFLSQPLPTKQIIEAYAAGVNAGLNALKKPPFEYQLLRAKPEPWRAEDTLLVAYAMYLDLEEHDARGPVAAHNLSEMVSPSVFEFLYKNQPRFQSAVDGTTIEKPSLPPAADWAYLEEWRAVQAAQAEAEATTLSAIAEDLPEGSNHFAIAGRYTATGAPLLAGDTHMGLRVPNVWMRAALHYSHDGTEVTLYGVTLPGVPLMIIGSNGQVAWNFTTAPADTVDLVVLEPGDNPDLYLTPDGPMPIEMRIEEIAVKGQESPVAVEFRDSQWGPVIAENIEGRELAMLWTAHSPQAIALTPFLDFDTAEKVEEAILLAHQVGMPAHNMLVADASGDLGWTIIGNLPQRTGFSDNALPVTSTDATWQWQGRLPAAQYPTLINPEMGRLWSANNRVVGGDLEAPIAGVDYSWDARAEIIEGYLERLADADYRDALDIMYSTDARQMIAWQEILLSALDEAAIEEDVGRTQFREFVLSWQGRAEADSVGYQLIRIFRARAFRTVLGRLLEPLAVQDPSFRIWHLPYEPPIYDLLTEQPDWLVCPDAGSWRSELLGIVDGILVDILESGRSLEQLTYGASNPLRMIHPFSLGVPFLGQWINMPDQPMNGDSWTPKAQNPAYGPSMRIVVSPGREDEGILQVPGGVSGNPLSPFFKAGHRDWIDGTATPLVPQEAVHQLTLRPE